MLCLLDNLCSDCQAESEWLFVFCVVSVKKCRTAKRSCKPLIKRFTSPAFTSAQLKYVNGIEDFKKRYSD